MELNLMQAGLVPIVIAIVSAIRVAGLPTRFAPVAAILLGVAGSIIFGDVSMASVLVGVVIGLSASGLYSGVKTTSGV